MKKFRDAGALALLLIVMMLGVVACQNDNETDPNDPEVIPDLILREDIHLSSQEQAVAGQSGDFAFNFLRTVAKSEKSDANIFVSPLSASLALLMLDNGAAGETHTELQKGLGLEGISRDAQNGYALKIVDAMTSLDTRAVFESANSIWIHEQFPVLDAFKKVNQDFFSAEVRNDPFKNPESVKLINAWISDKTHDKIKDMLDAIDPLAVMYLINTLYFKGYWEIPFDKKNTADEVFNNQDGSKPKLPTMQGAHGHYAKVDNYALLELEFGNRAFSTVFLLPDAGISLDDVITGLDEEEWQKDLYELPRGGWTLKGVKIPRFNIEYARELVEDLKAMGINTIFDGGADFSLINPTSPLAVSRVKQKTYVEVNEEGMEAAAATAVEIGVTSVPEIRPEAYFYVDRPFAFFVKEKSTGIIFFAGLIRNLK